MDFSAFEPLFTLREEVHDQLGATGRPADNEPIALLKRVGPLRERALSVAARARPAVAIADILKAADAPLPPLTAKAPPPAPERTSKPERTLKPQRTLKPEPTLKPERTPKAKRTSKKSER